MREKGMLASQSASGMNVNVNVIMRYEMRGLECGWGEVKWKFVIKWMPLIKKGKVRYTHISPYLPLSP